VLKVLIVIKKHLNNVEKLKVVKILILVKEKVFVVKEQIQKEESKTIY
jgi:hypothetical protein